MTFLVVLQIWKAVDTCAVDRKKGMSQMWGGHLRFFRQLVRAQSTQSSSRSTYKESSFSVRGDGISS